MVIVELYLVCESSKAFRIQKVILKVLTLVKEAFFLLFLLNNTCFMISARASSLPSSG